MSWHPHALSPARLLILSSRPVSSREQRLEKLAAVLGCEPRIEPWGAHAVTASGPLVLRDRAVAMSADAFLDLCDGHAGPEGLERLCADGARLLVFGWRADARHANGLHHITRGAIADIRPLHGTSCAIPLDGRDWSRQLAGSRSEREASPSDTGFTVGRSEPTAASILACGDLATCVAVTIGRRVLVCVGESDIADVDRAVSPDTGLEGRYAELLPYLIFLHGALGEACWRSALQTLRLIVDDPLLKQRYGQLRFDRLFASLARVDAGLTIAFIPWNCRRTTKRSAEYFRSHLARDRFSLCVHGCDHTEAEFAGRDASALQDRATLAMSRLASHQARTGIPFEPVMVFPQGRFSAAAPAMLRATGYLAAINTSLWPVDQHAVLTMRDLLAPAVTRFGGFPLFARHYAGDPHSAAALAFDLYLGRPAFIVEHHEFFGEGVPALESLIRELRMPSLGLQSLGLSDAVTRTGLMRRTGPGSTEVRFFADRFSLDNPGAETVHYTLSKDEPDPDRVETIAVNGTPMTFRKIEGGVTLDVDVDPGARLDLSVLTHRASHTRIGHGRAYRARVFARRTLSEFRDDVLGRHPASFRLARRWVGVAKWFRTRRGA